MSDKSSGRKKRAQERRRRRQGAWIRGLVITGAVLLAMAALGLILSSTGRGASAAIDYGPEDVSYERPILAVHEMDMPGMSMSPPIPFLPEGGPQPRIAVPETFYDFKTVGPTEVVRKEFVVANVGEAPLTISRAYTTCDCTTAEFTATVIPPGKVSLVTVIFDAGFHDVRGTTVRRGVIIENNDPKNSQVEIWIQAAVTR